MRSRFFKSLFPGTVRSAIISAGVWCACGIFGFGSAPSFSLALGAVQAEQSDESKEDDKPSLADVTEGYEEVKGPEGAETFYRLWVKQKDNQVLCGLPEDFAQQKHFIALTVASGELFAGLQGDDYYVYWRVIGDRLALIKKNTQVRSDGDDESKRSVSRLFTDQVLLDLPILATQDNGAPVFDMDELLVGRATEFFGEIGEVNQGLASIVQTKAFPKNVEIAFEVPTAGGTLQTLHYSFSLVPEKSDPNYTYQPRLADDRIGYFTTSYDDYGQYTKDEARVRYINRWNLEKKSPELKLSPPQKPIVFYIENTAPVRYRKWIRKGVDQWNKAFEKVGFDQAIIVHDQDSNPLYATYDPEDVRYNFIRWLNNDIGTAIGPSRVHPETGEILDADIILTDGWIRAFQRQFQKQMPKIAMEGMSGETLAWLVENPQFDPRVRMASPAQRETVQRQIQQQWLSASRSGGGPNLKTRMLGDEPWDGLLGRTSQVNGYCLAADGKTMDIALMRMALIMQNSGIIQNSADDDADKDDADKDGEPKEGEAKDDVQLLDGMPEEFIGPLVADLVCHEVGHTLGLRHNFKASSILTLDQINSDEVKDKRTIAGSVMDYIPTNFRLISGKVQGNYGMIDIGPYDLWAIEYGYSVDAELKDILKRVAEPELVFATDEDTSGPDPLARLYDFGKDPLDFAREQIALAEHHRQRILQDFVKDGDSWAKSREGYNLTLMMQIRATSMMANWIGGAFVNRDHKGDPNGRVPLEVVPADQQRKALKFVIEHSFVDQAYGLNPELLNRMTIDNWLDDEFDFDGEATWPLHDQIMGFQAATMTQLLNPTVLGRVYDNESRVEAEKDCFTLPELLSTVGDAVWNELEKAPADKASDRKPAISSLRRNLQAEHVSRLINLSQGHSSSLAALRPIATLAKQELRELNERIKSFSQANGGNLDSYSAAHLNDISDRIGKFLEAQYIAN